jgi:hypothetical protein
MVTANQSQRLDQNLPLTDTRARERHQRHHQLPLRFTLYSNAPDSLREIVSEMSVTPSPFHFLTASTCISSQLVTCSADALVICCSVYWFSGPYGLIELLHADAL